jgi:hypothetical protein
MAGVAFQAHPQRRDLQLRDRLVEIAIEAQAHGPRLDAHGGYCREQAPAVLKAARALATAARNLRGTSGHGAPTLNLFFPDPRSGGKSHDDESEEDNGSE